MSAVDGEAEGEGGEGGKEEMLVEMLVANLALAPRMVERVVAVAAAPRVWQPPSGEEWVQQRQRLLQKAVADEAIGCDERREVELCQQPTQITN
jgi:hypothetical protein